MTDRLCRMLPVGLHIEETSKAAAEEQIAKITTAAKPAIIAAEVKKGDNVLVLRDMSRQDGEGNGMTTREFFRKTWRCRKSALRVALSLLVFWAATAWSPLGTAVNGQDSKPVKVIRGKMTLAEIAREPLKRGTSWAGRLSERGKSKRLHQRHETMR